MCDTRARHGLLMTPAEIVYLLETPPGGPDWDGAEFLSASERERLDAMRFERRRHTWLLGRWAAKHLLRAVLPGSLERTQIQIENEAGGAPFAQVAGQRVDGCLTISHREDWALAAWTAQPGLQIGADLEIVPAENPDFLEDYLSPAELEIAARLVGRERACWMILCWSAKEAVLKALRIGLRVDTRSVEVLAQSQALPGAWSMLPARSTLPGTEDLRLWWQTEGDLVLTLAAAGSREGVGFRHV